MLMNRTFQGPDPSRRLTVKHVEAFADEDPTTEAKEAEPFGEVAVVFQMQHARLYCRWTTASNMLLFFCHRLGTRSTR